MRYAILMACLAITGCQADFLGYGDDVSTTTPTKEQIAYCRDVMYINPGLEIEPLGYCLQPGMDDVIRFKFTAKTDDPSQLFDKSQVDSTRFSPDFSALSWMSPLTSALSTKFSFFTFISLRDSGIRSMGSLRRSCNSS